MKAADYILFTDFGSHPTIHQEARAVKKPLIRIVKCLFICIDSWESLMQVFVTESTCKSFPFVPTKQTLKCNLVSGCSKTID